MNDADTLNLFHEQAEITGMIILRLVECALPELMQTALNVF